MFHGAGGAVSCKSGDEGDPGFKTPSPPAVAGRYETISEQFAPLYFEAQVCKRHSCSRVANVVNNQSYLEVFLALMY